EKKNKSNKIAICKACSNTNDPFTSIENLTNKRSICHNHLKNCSNFKALYNDETWNVILAKIIQEEKEDRQKKSLGKRKQNER
ncbi:18636_t:CDS:1, partial [Funneliformis geosporum]